MMNDDISKAFKELADAAERYNECSQQVSFARSAETTALNRLNNAQKALDELVASLRKAAPRDSDWRRSKGEPI